MERYDYRQAVKEDIKEWLACDFDNRYFNAYERDDLYGYIYDTLWVADSVTGNASGSYTMSRWIAEEHLCHNFDLLDEVAMEFGNGYVDVSKGAEWLDVSIRCYLLGECLDEVFGEWYDAKAGAEEEEEE